jgi:hypothetical protein
MQPAALELKDLTNDGTAGHDPVAVQPTPAPGPADDRLASLIEPLDAHQLRSG